MPPTDQLAAPDLRSAERQVRRAARRLVRTWQMSLAAVALVGVGFVCLLVWIWNVAGPGVSRTNVALCFLWTFYFVYEFVRFLPRTPPPDDVSIVLDGDAGSEVRGWIGQHRGGRQPVAIHLEPNAEVSVDLAGELHLGMAVVACLTEQELALLVNRASRRREPLLGRRLTRVHALLVGGVGRGLRTGKRWRWGLGSILLRRLAHDAGTFLDALARSDEMHDQTDDEATTRARAAQRVLDEGLDMLVDAYLVPALEVGAWHATPFSGLRQVLSAWEEGGADVWGGCRLDDVRHESPAHQVLESVMERELQLAERWVAHHPHDESPTPWSDHPARVDIPTRRRRTAAVLESARVATGQPQPATLLTVVRLVEAGWAETIVAQLVGPGPDESDPREAGTERADPTHAVVSQALSDLVTLTLLDAGTGRLAWSWRDGSHVVDIEGTLVDVNHAVARAYPVGGPHRFDDLLVWVATHGGDPAAPVWLAGGAPPGPEVPMLGFGAGRRARNVGVVLSDRAIHIFPGKALKAFRIRRLSHTAGSELLQAMLTAVRHERLDARVDTIPVRDVISAVARPGTGGHYWTLRIRTVDRRVRLHGQTDKDVVVAALREQLGERLSTEWWDLPKPLRWARNVWGYVGLGVGGLGVVFAVIWSIDRPDGMPAEALAWLGAAGGAVLLAAFVPDVLMRAWTSLRSPRLPMPE